MAHVDMERRVFTQAWVMALLGGATITIVGCGGGTPTSGSGGGGTGSGSGSGGPSGTDEAGVIDGNHGHSAIVTKAELDAGLGLTLSIMGTADHTHSLVLSGDQVVAIRNGDRVSQPTTTTNAHFHTITFN
jgi:hypothetical protein